MKNKTIWSNLIFHIYFFALFILVTDNVALSADAVCDHRHMQCIDCTSISNRDVITTYGIDICCIDNSYIGNGVDRCQWNTRTVAIVCINFGKLFYFFSTCLLVVISFLIFIFCSFFLISSNLFLASKCIQGIHTMLPISWPVSVVLAVFISAVHLCCRIIQDNIFLPMVSRCHSL